MRVAIYTRVSTADQHPEIQEHALRAYAEARGLEVVVTYTDHGSAAPRRNVPNSTACWRPRANARSMRSR